MVLCYVTKLDNMIILVLMCSFFLKNIFGLQSFYMNFSIYSISVKNIIDILVEVALNLQADSDSMDILEILNLSIHSHGDFTILVSPTSFTSAF